MIPCAFTSETMMLSNGIYYISYLQYSIAIDIYPRCSMVLEYLPTFTRTKLPSYVGKYSSTMDTENPCQVKRTRRPVALLWGAGELLRDRLGRLVHPSSKWTKPTWPNLVRVISYKL